MTFHHRQMVRSTDYSKKIFPMDSAAKCFVFMGFTESCSLNLLLQGKKKTGRGTSTSNLVQEFFKT